MNNFHFFVEYEWNRGNEIKIPKVFYERNLCEKNKHGLVRFKVTGIIEYYKETFIVFPKGMCISDEEYKNRQFAHLIYKVLYRYSKVNLLNDEEHDYLGERESTTIFELVQFLFEDYIQNGLIYTQRRIEQINGSGRINWSKTINKKSPVNINKKPIYLDLITSKNDLTSDQDLTIIHAIILKRITERFGWLFSFSFQYSVNDSQYDIKYMRYRLQKALQNTFVDREVRLFKLLLAFLNQQARKREDSNLNIYVTPFFSSVWEKICLQLMGDMKELHNNIPNPYWIFEGTKFKTSQIPDILVQKGNTIIVLDAKYYRIRQGLDKLPGWGDIVKQLFYSLSLKKDFLKVLNIFLLPSSCENGFEYLGYASVEQRESELGHVLAFGIDVVTAMRYYTDELKEEKRLEFINGIIEQSENIYFCS